MLGCRLPLLCSGYQAPLLCAAAGSDLDWRAILYIVAVGDALVCRVARVAGVTKALPLRLAMDPTAGRQMAPHLAISSCTRAQHARNKA